jgi:hypothetical protein
MVGLIFWPSLRQYVRHEYFAVISFQCILQRRGHSHTPNAGTTLG